MAAHANIRLHERERLSELLLPGYIVQVGGPPMVGKSTIVDQVLKDVMNGSPCGTSFQPMLSSGFVIVHRFSCKNAQRGQDVLRRMATALGRIPHTPDDLDHLTNSVLSRQAEVVGETDACRQTSRHHIFVFDKCESLVTHNADSWFLEFLAKLRRALPSRLATVVFTSYKRFEWCGLRGPSHSTKHGMVVGPMQDSDGNIFCTLEVGTLADKDILCALQHFAPSVNPNPYLQLFQRCLGFPEAVRIVAQIFLASGAGGGGPLPEALERHLKTDLTFLQTLFGPRLDEVIDWVGWDNLFIIQHFGSSLDSSATRECFRSVVNGENERYRWIELSYWLERFYIIRELPAVRRLVVHPLVVFFCKTRLRAIQISCRGRETNLFSNRFTHFLCATLSSLDAMTSLRGDRLKLVVGLLYECPNIRHVISMALLASEDSYSVYLKLAVSGAGMLSMLCPREVINFYACLYDRSIAYGRNRCEQAVLLGLFGQALANGTGTASVDQASGLHSEESTDHLSKAIDMLSLPGVEPSYYLLLFLTEKAKAKARQGKYDESLRTYKRARDLFGRVKTHALGEALAVTERKVQEIQLITLLYETVPMIFKGDNDKALPRLKMLRDQIEQDFPNSMELATVENQIGLCIQRMKGSEQEAKEWYLKSYQRRLLTVNINPKPLYAPLNNVAMLCYRDDDIGQFYNRLDTALKISREFDWLHYYTGLSLVHLAEGSIGLGNFKSALSYLKEAERILSITSKDHDLRLRALLEMVHVKVALEHHRPHYHPHRASGQDPWYSEDGRLVDYAKGKCEPVSHTDHTVSCRDYLNRLMQVAKEMKGTLSDDGHHFILSAFEHALLLYWGSDKFEEFRTCFFQHLEKNKFVEFFRKEKPDKFQNVHKHRDVYFYLKECMDENKVLNLSTFLQRQIPACTICKLCKDFFTVDMWRQEINKWTMKQKNIELISSSGSVYNPLESSSDLSLYSSSETGHDGFPRHAEQAIQSHACQVSGNGYVTKRNLPHHTNLALPVATRRKDGETMSNGSRCPREVDFAGLSNTHDIANNTGILSKGQQHMHTESCTDSDAELQRYDKLFSKTISSGLEKERMANSPDLYVLQGRFSSMNITANENPRRAFRQDFSEFSDEDNCLANQTVINRLGLQSRHVHTGLPVATGRNREAVEQTEMLSNLAEGLSALSAHSKKLPVEDEEVCDKDNKVPGRRGMSDDNKRGIVSQNTERQDMPRSRPEENIWPPDQNCVFPTQNMNGLVHLYKNVLVGSSGYGDLDGNNIQTLPSHRYVNIFNDQHLHKCSHVEEKNTKLQQGMKELLCSRSNVLKYLYHTHDHCHTTISSSGLGSTMKSTDGSLFSPFLNGVTEQPPPVGNHFQHCPNGGARPKTYGGKRCQKEQL